MSTPTPSLAKPDGRTIEAHTHTVFLMMGPTGSGKSTMAQEIAEQLYAQFNELVPNTSPVALLSVDSIRETLLGVDVSGSSDPRMTEVSGPAFALLEAELKAAMDPSVNKEFIIVDTRGLSKSFRNRVKGLADASNYKTDVIMIDVDAEEYLNQEDERTAQAWVWDLDHLKRRILPEFCRSDYHQVHEMGWHVTPKVEIVNMKSYARNHLVLNEEDAAFVIGDIHEHTEAFYDSLQLIQDIEVEDGQKYIICVGDYLDKGGNTAHMIEMMEHFAQAGGRIVKGNHENYVYRRLTGMGNSIGEKEAEYFTSLSVLQADEALAKRFIHLFENYTLPFVKIIGYNRRTTYVTHAPCQDKFLGKVDEDSQREQRNLRTKFREEDYRLNYGFLFEEAAYDKPLHIFGHVAHGSERTSYKNKVFLDTGAVYGGKLTIAVLKDTGQLYLEIAAKALVPGYPLNPNLTSPWPA